MGREGCECRGIWPSASHGDPRREEGAAVRPLHGVIGEPHHTRLHPRVVDEEDIRGVAGPSEGVEQEVDGEGGAEQEEIDDGTKEQPHV